MNVTKKYTVKITTAVLFLIIAITGISAQAKGGGSGNLRPVAEENFYFYTLQDPLLFPETAFETNPAVLRRTGSTVIVTENNFEFRSSSETAERLDETVGSKGGTYTIVNRRFDPAAQFSLFFPLLKVKNKPVLGFSLDFDMDYELQKEEYINYRAFSENVMVEQSDKPFIIGSDLYFSSAINSVFWGVSGGYDFYYAPALLKTVTDANLPDEGTYVETTVRDHDTFSHTADVSLGTIIPLSRAAELSFAVNYQAEFTDKQTSYIAVDTNGDGNNDTILKYSDYVFYDAPGGPATLASDYDAKDLTISNIVTIHPTMRLYVADSVELFFGGQYTILDRTQRTYYQRVILVNDPGQENESIQYETFDASYTSFKAAGGLAVLFGKNSLLKAGVGFLRDDRRFSQDGKTAVGVNLYNRQNPEHYTELNLGLEPANNSIAANVEYPSTDVEQSILLRLGLENKPPRGVQTYFAVDLAASRDRKTYFAYNLDTRSVWKEEVVSEGIVWDLTPVAGIAFPVGKKKNGVWSVSLKGTGTAGNLFQISETAPFDESIGKTTTDGSIDSERSTGFNFDIKTGFVFMFK
jgi:hypothetical protein